MEDFHFNNPAQFDAALSIGDSPALDSSRANAAGALYSK